MAKSTIYRHWPDKISLIADACEAAHEHAVPSVEGLTARESLQRLLCHVAGVVADSVFSSCIPALIEGAALAGLVLRITGLQLDVVLVRLMPPGADAEPGGRQASL